MTRKKAWITLLLTVAIAWGSLAAMLALGWSPKLGLDLQGGFAITLVAPEGTDPDTLEAAADIMRDNLVTGNHVVFPNDVAIGFLQLIIGRCF